jgi:hypothetical protein
VCILKDRGIDLRYDVKDCSMVERKALESMFREALAVDVFSTVRKYGFPIEVLSDFSQAMNRYAFLLVE